MALVLNAAQRQQYKVTCMNGDGYWLLLRGILNGSLTSSFADQNVLVSILFYSGGHFVLFW